MSSELSYFEKDTCTVVELIGKRGIYYWLQEPVTWFDVDADIHRVPSGWLSDGYSVPEILWGLCRGLRSRLPAYSHDHAYVMHDMSRKQADANLRDGIISTGGNRWTAWKVWAGVRLGGWIAWNKYERMRKAGINLDKMFHADTIEEAKEKASKI